MSRRGAWKGAIPGSPSTEARRHLLEVAQGVHRAPRLLEGHAVRRGREAAGVTRPTVYRYFGSADELFNAAAVTASGGFLERLRSRTARFEDPVERVIETLVISICEVPDDPNLREIFRMSNAVSIHSAVQNAFVADELRLYFGDRWQGADGDLDELAEILLRLLKSFVDDPGPERDVAELRQYLSRWLVPMLVQRSV